jgi:dihydrofolate reductase
MGTIEVVDFVSLDGVLQAPLSIDEDRDGGFEAGGWVTDRMDDDVAAIMAEATTSAAAMLLGRRTNEKFAEIWPEAESTGPVAAMNQMVKYVVSRTRPAVSWQNTIVLEDVERDVPPVKRDTDGTIVVFGSGDLLQSLFRHRLVDVLRLLVFPVVLGRGKRIFGAGTPALSLELHESSVTAGGVVVQRYLLPRA